MFYSGDDIHWRYYGYFNENNKKYAKTENRMRQTLYQEAYEEKK